ncbi:MAG: SRPBCC family protein [Pseudomonadales bacterium]|nr:SRPBCC family protein [Pseudomonadales bacterium]
MFDIKIERIISAPIDKVFDAISDHESYSNYNGITLAQVVETGKLEKNGEGALRQMGGSSIELFERITKFQRPSTMHYRIERSKPFKIEHLKGEIRLFEQGEKTKVVWESSGRVHIALIGKLMDKQLEKNSARLFGSILKGIDHALSQAT